jgi:cellulose biosynthesis protein BcsQ
MWNGEGEERSKHISIALLSGKGGCGKTVLGLAMARILAELDLKVLLIDCDVYTHGATYFFESQVQKKATITLYGMMGQPQGSDPLRPSGEGFYFIPSCSDVASSPAFGSEVFTDSLNRSWQLLQDLYDVIILDCQAGYSDVTRWATSKADRRVVILEVDAVSNSAVRVLTRQLYEYLLAEGTWFLFCKVMEDDIKVLFAEREQEKLTGMRTRLFNTLRPIPFDQQVRRAFAEGTTPDVLGETSAFSVAVMEVVQELFPDIRGLGDLVRERVGKQYAEISQTLYDLSVKKKRVGEESIKLSRTLRLRKTRAFSVLIALVGCSLAALGFFGLLATKLSYALVGALSVLFSYIWSYFAKQDISVEALNDTLRREVEMLEDRARRFEGLLKTSPARSE